MKNNPDNVTVAPLKNKQLIAEAQAIMAALADTCRDDIHQSTRVEYSDRASRSYMTMDGTIDGSQLPERGRGGAGIDD
jgi:hypothetical protein|tara:strand:- start:124 stop:357 length:234 start_codon:yes stop_codon:yes gene_type:complete